MTLLQSHDDSTINIILLLLLLLLLLFEFDSRLRRQCVDGN